MAALLRRFARDLEVGDSVITPVSGQQRFLVGTIASDYRFAHEGEPGLRHRRNVLWQAEVPASNLPGQLRRALGSPMVLYLPAAQGDLRTFLHEQGLLGSPGAALSGISIRTTGE